MNQKNYKEIAKIIKKRKEIGHDIGKGFVLDLADYFEKEDLKLWEKNKVIYENRFDKRQFLKDCGVKE